MELDLTLSLLQGDYWNQKDAIGEYEGMIDLRLKKGIGNGRHKIEPRWENRLKNHPITRIRYLSQSRVEH